MFAMGGNQDIEKSNIVKGKMLYYLEVNGSDPQVEDGIRVLDAFSAEFHRSGLEVSSEISAPIFDRLSATEEWDFYDIRLLTAVVGYNESYEKTYEFAEKALKKLEKHSNEERYAIIKLSIHMNVVNRLLRAKYYDVDNLTPTNELEEWFSQYATATMAICDDGGFSIHKGALMVRSGLFHQDDKSVEKGLKLLEKIGADEVYRMMENDISEYNFLIGLKMSKRQFNRIIGSNIRKKRIEFGLTMEVLSKSMELSNAALGFMERGERGTTSFNLYKLADIFGVPMEYFYAGVNETTSLPSQREIRFKKLDGFTKHLTDSELDFLIQMAKRLPKARETKS